jgi:dsRNA-specific ribonuclease
MAGAFFSVGFELCLDETRRISSGVCAVRWLMRWAFQKPNLKKPKQLFPDHLQCGCTLFADVSHELVSLYQTVNVKRHIEHSAVQLCYQFGLEPNPLIVVLFCEALNPRKNKGASDLEDASNDRLEFLGDAVLDMVVVPRLFQQLPDAPPSVMHDEREKVARNEQLAVAAWSCGLHKFMFCHTLRAREALDWAAEELAELYSDTSDSRDDWGKDTGDPDVALMKQRLADTLEAVTGALYINAGASGEAKMLDVVDKLLYPVVFHRHLENPMPGESGSI